MRLVLGIVAISLFTTFAQAADWPGIKGTPDYPQARRELIRQGFTPVAILSRSQYGTECPNEMCRIFPEVLDCSQGRLHCTYLFRQRKTGKYWIAFSDGDGDPPHFTGMQYAGMFPARLTDLRDLEELVIRGPDGRPFKYRPATGPAHR